MTLTIPHSNRCRNVSVGASILLHALLIFGPLLLGLIHSMLPPVLLPQGHGDPDAGTAASTSAARPRPKPQSSQRQRTEPERPHAARQNLTGLVFKPESGIDRDSNIRTTSLLTDLMKLTDRTYVATSNVQTTDRPTSNSIVDGKARKSGKKAGKFGKGGIGDGGYPDGAFGGCIPFVRIQYDGKGWDDGLDPEAPADARFLAEFSDITKLPVAPDGQAVHISQLKNYPKGYAPPFVYMTGEAGINIPPADMQALREYINEGGMIFADCGTAEWGNAFRAFAAQLLPDNPLCDIPDDDLIYFEPFQFPNGVPSLWHHGGDRAEGCRRNGRLVVFYFPGDMNDAWKPGNARAEVEETAVEIGSDVVCYAVTQYLNATKQYRK